MCASSPEKVEILVPPADVQPGDRVTCSEYPGLYRTFLSQFFVYYFCHSSHIGTPDVQLNPKKKIWEAIQPDLHTNADRYACYKDALWVVGDKGNVRAGSLSGVMIK